MLLLVGGFLVLMLIGVPVAVSMAVASVAYLLVYNVAPDLIAAQRMIAGVESFPLLAVPFFILAGNLMNIAGVTGRIYSFALALVGWMKGGLAQVNIIGSVIFAGMSGTALADAAGIGTIEIKAMKDHGYPVEAAVGVTAASSTLGPIFPPSLPFVIYGMMANVSIGALFMAGIVPGVVMTLLMMIAVAFFAYKHGWGSDTPFSLAKLGEASLEILVVALFPVAVYLLILTGLSINIAVLIALVALVALDWYFDFSAVMALMTPVILIGGMTMGWFTPTEAAMAAVIWSLFLGLVRYRTMTIKNAHQSQLRHDRDHGFGAVHRHRGVDLRLALDGESGGGGLLQFHFRADRQQMGVPDPGQHPDAGGRLFPGHDRGDHHPGADPASGRDEIWRGSRAFRPHHDAEPDDRSPSSAAWHGALCLVAGCKTVGRAHHHGDSALAGAAGPGIAADHLRAGDHAVAAAAGRADQVAYGEWT